MLRVASAAALPKNDPLDRSQNSNHSFNDQVAYGPVRLARYTHGAPCSYQQFQTNRAKLRLDLYERRFRIFDGVRELLSTVYRNDDVTLEDIRKFRVSTNEAVFLFGPEISTYLDELHKRAVDLRSLNDKLHESGLPIGKERTEAAEKKARVLEWLTTQFEESRKRFGKYLDFCRAF